MHPMGPDSHDMDCKVRQEAQVRAQWSSGVVSVLIFASGQVHTDHTSHLHLTLGDKFWDSLQGVRDRYRRRDRVSVWGDRNILGMRSMIAECSAIIVNVT